MAKAFCALGIQPLRIVKLQPQWRYADVTTTQESHRPALPPVLLTLRFCPSQRIYKAGICALVTAFSVCGQRGEEHDIHFRHAMERAREQAEGMTLTLADIIYALGNPTGRVIVPLFLPFLPSLLCPAPPAGQICPCLRRTVLRTSLHLTQVWSLHF